MQALTSYLLFFIYKLFYFTWRIRIVETDAVKKYLKENQSFLIAHWHGDELGILHLLKRYDVACIVSTSKDGELMNRAVQLLGGETVRGSSTRGGANALKGIIRLTKNGRRPSVAVDGPKGPIYKVKPGILQISRLTQRPIIPIAIHASNPFIFKKSWNQTVLPLPFCKLTICWGEELPPISKAQNSRADELTLDLENKIHATRALAAKTATNPKEFF